MGFTDQGTPIQSPSPPRLPEDGDLSVDPATEPKVNWLFSGVMLGAASWMLILGTVFAAIGNWIVAGVLFGGALLCGLAIWRAGQRRAGKRGRHRSR
jgi:hypothetical protein